MQRTKFLIFGWLLIIYSWACSNQISSFTLYKTPPVDSLSKLIRINGVYTSLQKNNTTSIGLTYFFEDGKIWMGAINQINKGKIPKDGWGHYKIIKDSLYIQMFVLDNQNFHKRDIMEIFGILLSDSTFYITRTRCVWCKGVYSNFKNSTDITKTVKDIMQFKESIKIDSTAAWFHHEKWYQNGLNEHK